MRKAIILILCFILLASLHVNAAGSATALPTSSRVELDGQPISCAAYNINGNNFFKLRDFMQALNKGVTWDAATNTIYIDTSVPYTADGSEGKPKGDKPETALPTNSKILLNGLLVNWAAYNIEGNNYFKLRDILKALNIYVDFSSELNTVYIDTSKGYMLEQQIAAPASFRSLELYDYDGLYELRRDNPLDDRYLSAINEFACQLAQHTLSGQENNMCVSPISLYTVLSLAAEGAQGDIQRELVDVLGLYDTGLSLKEQTGNLMRLLYTDNQVSVLKIVNSVWAKKGELPSQEYLDSASQDYYASIFSVDFSDSNTGKLAGQWISENTGGLLSPDIHFNKATLMAIISTVYLKDEWVDRFDENNTKSDIFTKKDGVKIDCDFMQREDKMAGYFKGDIFSVSSLRLKSNCSIAFILPNEGYTPEDVLADSDALSAALSGAPMEAYNVVYKIPRFSFDSEPSVQSALNMMGVSKISNLNTGFAEIMQQTHVGINETGVEATAFTMLQIFSAHFDKEIAYMTLDKPFLFAIRSEEGVPLFIGVVNDPNSNGR